MPPDVLPSYRFCESVARREARNFYPMFLLLPADRRRSMCALYAFLRHSDDIADDPYADPAAGRQTLDAWRAALDGAITGKLDPAHSDWSGWPAVAEMVARHGVPGRYLHEVLDGVEADLTPRAFETFEALHAYCYKVASAVGLCCLHVWGFQSDGGRAEELADAAGLALQLTNILRDVKEDARLGRVYLPADDLARFGVTPADLTAATAPAPLRRLLAFEARRAYDFYERAAPLSPLIDPVGRPVYRAIVGVYRALLDEIVRKDYDVLAGRVSVPAWRKAAVAARALAGRFAGPSRPPTPREAASDS